MARIRVQSRLTIKKSGQRGGVLELRSPQVESALVAQTRWQQERIDELERKLHIQAERIILNLSLIHI